MTKCLICGAKGDLKYKEIDIYECKNCGLLYKNYSINYNEYGDEYYEMFNYNRKKEVKKFEKIIYKYFPKNKKIKLLEIGCGSGAILNEFNKDGFDVYGIEPSKAACEMAKSKFGLKNIINGYFNSKNFNFSPDVIILTDVIEHIQDPVTLFNEVNKIMSERTLFLIKSGNSKSINAKLYPAKWGYYRIEQHIAFYSKKSLKYLCERSSLKLDKFYIFINYFGGLLFKDYLKNILKAIIFRISNNNKIFDRFSISNANDHFIAVIKK
jgi:SAM-dependent methyltransferase